ncbi:CAP domain-containing protein [Streptomyces sp. NPDC091272]|uniref:CAP domain-containing protein n=1 Tax=Streptomyces sp. NPDC091272 TaxID=3365981 RepID=UPI003805A70B
MRDDTGLLSDGPVQGERRGVVGTAWVRVLAAVAVAVVVAVLGLPGAGAVAAVPGPPPPVPQYGPGEYPRTHEVASPVASHALPPPYWEAARSDVPLLAAEPPHLAPAPSRQRANGATSLVRLLNRERARAGCAKVRARSSLAYAAQQHSGHMARTGTLTHVGAPHRAVGERLTAAGYRWSRAAENVAAARSDAGSAMRVWMQSPTHRAAMLTCAFRDVGVGVVPSGGRAWWTLVLASRAG